MNKFSGYIMDASKRVEPAVSSQTLQQRANPDRSLATTIYVPEQGGYQEKFLKHVEEKYKCEKCRLVLCNPRQTECGHRFCETCMNSLLSSSSPQCTACEEIIIKDKVFKDNCCRREVLALQMYCRNDTRGCKEQITLGNLLIHLKSDCQFEELPCPRADCKDKVFRKDLSEHIEKKCKYREMPCQYCKNQVPLAEMQLNAHLAECVNAPSTCSFKRYGCSFKGTNQQIKAHEASSAVQHVNLMKEWSSFLESKVSLLQNESSEKNKSIQILHKQMCNFEVEIERHKEMLRNNESKIHQLQRVIEGQAEKLKDLDKEIHSLRQTGEDADNIKSTLESLQARLAQLETISKTAAAWNPGVLETQINRHDQMLSVHDIRLADMDLRFQVLETASYNGILIWKIRDYKRRKQEAVMGKTLSLYSQPFYTGYFGYKMCARVYLNGDGMGKNTHLSLFFVIMRGEYDSLLPWPFKQKVSLMLMDQGPSRRHLGDAFKPDPNSSSFKKPTGEMNIASGCPVFVAQTVLENGTYIKDDTIFIKVIVDTSDLPDP
ncbi:TNF receptor-associated factor 3 isoform X3 [Rana temporaria]|uniref:TNF receptor-associated factor 3 isoform X3 n=1 Tax=Rana temporaria TaxID=8407 RepID=UPI001AADC2D5|nr:TNF receptor-associated factor 3 isoform X3 [Rana temporaria]